MDAQAFARELLAAYGRMAGLPGLDFDAQGCARLMFGDGVAVDLEIDSAADCLQMYGVIGPVPAGDREHLYRGLLEANLFGTQTNGATLAIDGVQEEVLLCQRVPAGGTTPADFAELIASFAGTLGHWLQEWHSGELQRGRGLPPGEAMNALLRLQHAA